MFKEGDYIKVKDGIELDLEATQEVTKGWGGKIVEIDKDEDIATIQLDAQTLNGLSDDYLKDSFDNGLEAKQYYFYFDDLIKAERRDTNATYKKALKRVDEIVAVFIEDEFDDEIHEIWIDEFIASSIYKNLDEYQQEKAAFVAKAFLDYMYGYLLVIPEEWSVENLEEVCLDIVPNKITAEEKLFDHYGEILIEFLKFLDGKEHVGDTTNLQQHVFKIKDRIAENAKDPKNWGMAKSFAMEAQNAGVDPTDFQSFSGFMEESYGGLLSDSQPALSTNYKNPYKDIGRNEKVTVKYNDGVVKENVKFKKVEKDLLDGRCELME